MCDSKEVARSEKPEDNRLRGRQQQQEMIVTFSGTTAGCDFGRHIGVHCSQLAFAFTSAFQHTRTNNHTRK